MAYITKARFRLLSKIAVGELSDTDLDSLIALADDQLEEDFGANLDSSLIYIQMAAFYMCMILYLQSKVAEDVISGETYRLGEMSVEHGNVAAKSQAIDFYTTKYRELITRYIRIGVKKIIEPTRAYSFYPEREAN